MQHRVKLLNGNISWLQAHSGGTSVLINMPSSVHS